jgi:hypothetical protein
MSDDLWCLDCESEKVSLFANDPINPTGYQLKCEAYHNDTDPHDSIIYDKYWKMMRYQYPNLVEHINNIRRCS